MTTSPVGRTGRVINSPNKLALRMHADLKSEALSWLPNGTTFRIVAVVGSFWEIHVPSFNRSGFVWTGTGVGDDDAKTYVELVAERPDHPPPIEPPYPPFKSKKPDYTGWGIGAAIIFVIGSLVYACGGPVR